jgi:hypothetical protein
MKNHEIITPYFIVLWILLGVGSVLFFQFSRNVRLKKRILPVFIIGSGALFALFVLISTEQTRASVVVIPAVALISFLNLRIIKICNEFSNTIASNVWFAKAEYCSKYGAKLQT